MKPGLTGLNGKTTVFNFKPVFGLGDKEFATTKKYWCWAPETSEQSLRKETFTAKEAGQRFLETLFRDIKSPDKFIIGEPAIRDQTWKENFRRHMRELSSSSVGRTGLFSGAVRSISEGDERSMINPREF